MPALLIADRRPYPRAVRHLAPLTGDDAELVRRIAAAAPGRDDAAEAELCRRFAPRIRFYGLRHLRNEAAAADLVQDVLLMILQKLRAREVREPERVASFILGTCRQVVIDGRRVNLAQIDCPLLTITAERDFICPPRSAAVLNDLAGSADKQLLNLPFGHISVLTGSQAASHLWPQLGSWLVERSPG